MSDINPGTGSRLPEGWTPPSGPPPAPGVLPDGWTPPGDLTPPDSRVPGHWMAPPTEPILPRPGYDPSNYTPPDYANDYDYFGMRHNETNEQLIVSCDYIKRLAQNFTDDGFARPTTPELGIEVLPTLSYDHYNKAHGDCLYDYSYLNPIIEKLNHDQGDLVQKIGAWFSYWDDYADGLSTAAAWYEQAEADNEQHTSTYFTHVGQTWKDGGGWEENPELKKLKDSLPEPDPGSLPPLPDSLPSLPDSLPSLPSHG